MPSLALYYSDLHTRVPTMYAYIDTHTHTNTRTNKHSLVCEAPPSMCSSCSHLSSPRPPCRRPPWRCRFAHNSSRPAHSSSPPPWTAVHAIPPRKTKGKKERRWDSASSCVHIHMYKAELQKANQQPHKSKSLDTINPINSQRTEKASTIANV